FLVQVHHVGQQHAQIEAALGAGPGHRTDDVEPGREAVGRRVVEHRVGAPWRYPEAHGGELDVKPRGVERHVLDLALLGHGEAVDLEHHVERVDGGIDQLEAGAG